MPRSLHYSEPKIINEVVDSSVTVTKRKYLEIATTNKNKLREIKAILTDYEIVGKDIDIEEIQSLDCYKVVSHKAKQAFYENGYNPILVEDTSLEISGLNNRPGTYAKDFLGDIGMRELICKTWLIGKDRSALARVLLALYDGKEVHIWEGKINGTISDKPRGKNGFTWDDIFVPEGYSITFAQMTDEQKNRISMRKLAAQEFAKSKLILHYPVLMLPEPFTQELQRVRVNKLQDKKAINFAYSLESIEKTNRVNAKFTAPNYSPITSTSNSFFTRYLVNPDTASLGLMLTDVDRKQLKSYFNGNPILWQMGPERRHLALAQRAEYFLSHQSDAVHKILDELDGSIFPKRTNKRSIAIEEALGIKGYESVTKAVALNEIGYKKISSPTYVSRTKSANFGLFNKIGKYARSIYGIGSLPFISGWRDVITTSALGHMLVFVHRNNINAIDFNNQIKLINEARKAILSLNLAKKSTDRALRNIGAALGSDPKKDLKKALELNQKAGVTCFRIYTINSDSRVIETAQAIRQKLGDKVEIFVGQVVDKKQCLKLISPDVAADGLIFGHGGGRQCTSAINGMALGTLEELYQITIDRQFNNTSIFVEGGLGSYVGGLLVMGVDCILRNAQFANCVIEQGDLYFEHKDGKICQPYHGSASAATMIIESYAKQNIDSRLFYSGRTKKVEGKSGYIFYKERANSMAFYVEEFKHFASRTLADLGVETLYDLRVFLEKNHEELFRLITPEAKYTSTAWRSP